DGVGGRSYGVVDRVRCRGGSTLEPMVCDLFERRAKIRESACGFAMQCLTTDSRHLVVEPLAVEGVREPQATVSHDHESAARDVVQRRFDVADHATEHGHAELDAQHDRWLEDAPH